MPREGQEEEGVLQGDEDGRAELVRNARRWLADKSGRKELNEYLVENLLVNLQIEKEEGQGASGRMMRKQFAETAQLVTQLVASLDEK